MGKGTVKKIILPIALILTTLCLSGIWLYCTWEKIPSSIRIKAGVSQELAWNLPVQGEVYLDRAAAEEEAVPAVGMQMQSVKEDASIQVNFGNPVTFVANQMQNYKMDVKLFGFIPFKTVDVQVIPDEMLIPAGVPIGIYVKTDGIMVIAEGEFEGQDHTRKEPAKHVLQSGDYILKVDGEEIGSKTEFMEKVNGCDGSELVLTIRRNEETFDVKVKPELNLNGEYKLGIWIRDNAQGVGTMTYLEADHTFGALGHGINDTDTTLLMEVKSGSLYKTEIVSVKKGQDGTPGELTGVIDYNLNNKIGTVEANSVGGIFGTLNEDIAQELQSEALPIGLKQDVQAGSAQILCCVDGNITPQLYDIEITAIHLDHDNVNRGLELHVTDPDLLAQTGGIVQGMSGSPILQDGKIIGAVTHVLVNDPTRGYGIFIENMLAAAS
ncbi:MAG: SpoIVB peptidase [Eubacteriales bacterium]|nr:SpoIVB peptidase [Eubacteriales bacterium]